MLKILWLLITPGLQVEILSDLKLPCPSVFDVVVTVEVDSVVDSLVDSSVDVVPAQVSLLY